MKHIGTLLSAAVMGLVISATAAAQAKPEQLVKQRQAAMTLQGKYFGPLGAMAQGKAPYNAELVRQNAAFLEVLAKMPWDGFAASTKDVKSATLPAAYTDTAKFKEAQDRSQSEISKLVSVSKSGDEAAVKAQLGAVGKSCGGCHENFREKQQ
ncbi:MAG: cytochrome c [Betaproteobacteria bacterium]|nr:MAG: cytochrome c [Betaproteobacteria bacterium]